MLNPFLRELQKKQLRSIIPILLNIFGGQSSKERKHFMPYKMLVVDDTAFMRKMAADCLKQHGHTVIGEAVNGKEGIQKYKELSPDIVMMDLMMPEMNGIDAIKEILALNPEAVILVCSVSNQQKQILDAMEAGAKCYLTKVKINMWLLQGTSLFHPLEELHCRPLRLQPRQARHTAATPTNAPAAIRLMSLFEQYVYPMIQLH